MPKPKKQSNITQTVSKPTQILLDESFLLCASGFGCDSTECEDEAEERDSRALAALILAYDAKVLLVMDDSERVITFYHNKYDLMSREVKRVLNRWLSGRDRRIIQRKPAKIAPKVVKECNLKVNTLDPLLCQLAITSGGNAPIWTLDSDFWCAAQFQPEIKPTCPKEALASVR